MFSGHEAGEARDKLGDLKCMREMETVANLMLHL